MVAGCQIECIAWVAPVGQAKYTKREENEREREGGQVGGGGGGGERREGGIITSYNGAPRFVSSIKPIPLPLAVGAQARRATMRLLHNSAPDISAPNHDGRLSFSQ